ncbi:MAG: N-6 DNA methylase, partial [Alistipes sp.]
QVPKDFANTWGKSSTDPSKGLYFVEYIANCVNNGRLITLLPMSCAITTSGVIANIKHNLLENHTLDAVFSFPTEMFYPGASAVACCMVFDLGKPHPKDYETFFGYFKDDGFEKRKSVGRIDVKNAWENEIEAEWLNLYRHRSTKAGKSIVKNVTVEDEWCAEAYMETDYSNISAYDFIEKLQAYAAFLIQNEK